MLRRMIASVLVAVLGWSMAGSALAHHGSWHKGGPPGSRFQSRFDDWATDFWANEALARMITKGVIQGNGDGTIAASRPVTRLEAAIMLMRLLNLEEPQIGHGEIKLKAPWGELEIKSDDDEFEIEIETDDDKFKFKDSNSIPSWGRGAILTALREGFLIFDGASLSPMAPLNRLEAAIMMVKAAKLDAEAVSRAGAELQFSDAKRIPDRLKGYIAVAVEQQFVNGYEDGTFRPQKLVSRAEWAALLDRLDRQGPGVSPDGRQVKGSVTAVNIGDAPSIAMTTPVFPGGVTYPVDDTAVFYKAGQEVTIADIAVGDHVIINLSVDRKILMVTVHNAPRQVTGTVTAYTAPTAAAPGSLSLSSAAGAASTYAIPATVTVTLGGQAATLAEIRIGDQVILRLEGASVKQIAIKADPVTVTGTLTAVTAGTDSTLPAVTVQTAANASATYQVADHATIGAAGGQALTLADLKAGDAVTLRTERNLAVRITVTAGTAITTVSGTVSAYTAPSGTAAGSIELAAADGTETTYAIQAGATVALDTTAATLADVRVGDQVTLTLEQGQASHIAIEVRSLTVSGTVAAAVPGAGGTANTLVVTGADNVVATYTLTAQTTITTAAGATLAFADLKAGDAVTLQIQRNLVVSVTVTRASNQASGTVSAYTAPSGSAAGSLSLTAADGSVSTYAVTATATVTLGTTAGTLADVQVGDQATLTFENEQLKQIAIQVQGATVSGTLAAVVPGANASATLVVTAANGLVSTFIVNAETAITTAAGLELTLADLTVGDAVSLQVERDRVVTVTVTRVSSEASGTVSAYTAPSGSSAGSLTLTASGGATATYAVPAATTVSVGTEAATLADVKVGDQVTLSFEHEQLKQIAIQVQTVSASGTLAAVVLGTNGAAHTLVVTASNGVVTTYAMAADATIATTGGAQLSLADLTPGDAVTLQIERDLVVSVTVTRVSSEASGAVSAYTAPAGTTAGSLTLTAADGTSSTYAVSAAVTVALGADAATLADVRVGDQVTLTFEHEQLTHIAIAVQTVTVSGTLAAAVPGTDGAPSTLVVTGADGVVTTYTMAAEATVVTSNGTQLTFADLNAGDAVTLAVVRSLVATVTVTTALSEVSGTVSAYTAPSASAAGSLALTAADGTVATYAVSAAVTVTLDGQAATLAEVRLGDTVTLTLDGVHLTRIAIQVQTVSVAGVVASVTPAADGALASITVTVGTEQVTYAVAADAVVTDATGAAITLADLAVGTAVTLQVERNLVVQITVTATSGN